MSVTFEANLSPTSLKKLVKDLDSYAKKLEESKMAIHQALADRVYELIISECPVDTGELIDSFIIDVSNDMATVYTLCEHAKYVEFGTGVRGQTSSYPIEEAGIIVNDNWKGYNTQVQGQVAQKFMYNAWLQIKKEGPSIIENVLKERGLL